MTRNNDSHGQDASLSHETLDIDHTWVAVGQIQGMFGIKGWVRVLSFTQPFERILEFSQWWLGKESPVRLGDTDHWQQVQLLSGQKQRRGVIAQLLGVSSPEAAQRLAGLTVWVPREQLPAPEDGTHYWADLVGLLVTTEDGEVLGSVEYLFATGANDVLVVRGLDGQERLLPFTHEVVQNVNVTARTITVSLLPGM